MSNKKLLKRIKELEQRVIDYIKVNSDLKCYTDHERKEELEARGQYGYITNFWSGQLLYDRFQELYQFLGVKRQQEDAKTFLKGRKPTLSDLQAACMKACDEIDQRPK